MDLLQHIQSDVKLTLIKRPTGLTMRNRVLKVKTSKREVKQESAVVKLLAPFSKNEL